MSQPGLLPRSVYTQSCLIYRGFGEAEAGSEIKCAQMKAGISSSGEYLVDSIRETGSSRNITKWEMWDCHIKGQN